jgi:conjugal transfer pilus assembly protein TraB
MANIQEKLREYWATRRPEQQFRIKAGAALVVFLFVAWVGSSAIKRAHPPAQDVSNSSTILLGNTSKLNASEQQQQIDALQQQMDKLNKLLASGATLSKEQLQDLIDQQKKNAPPTAGSTPTAPAAADAAQQSQIAALQAQIAALQSQVAQRNAEPVMPPSVAPTIPTNAPGIVELSGVAAAPASQSQPATPSTDTLPPPPVAPEGVGGQVRAVAPKGVAQGLGRIGGQPEEQGSLNVNEKVKVNSRNDAYLPPGTIITGVTLNGVNVGTGQEAQSNPQIVEVRIKKPAIMPNGYRINLNNCMIIATGFGNLPAQRIYLRPTTMSCVGPGGVAIESAIKGYVVGDDGISGMRGTVVSHQGELLEKGFFAGMLSGLGSAFSPQTVTPLSINPGSTTQYQYPSVSSVVGNSVGSGVNNAAGMIAKFYIDQAKALQPTLQVNPGTSVDIILEQGASVKKQGMTRSELAQTAWEASGSGQGNGAPSEKSQAAAAISRVAPNAAQQQPSQTAAMQP